MLIRSFPSASKTKIVCTIGPATLAKKTLQNLYKVGMNGARINTAYGTFEQHKRIIENVRVTADVPIIMDIKGPEIRLQVEQKQTLEKGDILEVGFHNEEVKFSHDVYSLVKVNDDVYIDNGKIKTKIVEKKKRTLRLFVMNRGEIADGKGVNIPMKRLSIPTLSLNDLKIVELAKKQDVDYLALSFTRSVKDIHNVRAATKGFKGAIIAKIENFEGIQNFEGILENSDGIMVARGDLGVEIPPEKVPLVQKSIIKRCNQSGKTVITATDMLESMIDSPVPTRAEVSDVANAVLDGTDAVMLSGETSIGKYPVEAVSMLTRIAKETETSVKSKVAEERFINISDTISKSIQRVCQNMTIDKIVTLTRSGYTAKMIARFRVQPVIIAVTPKKEVKKQLELVYGVHPVHFDYRQERDRIFTVAMRLKSMKLVQDEETILFTAAFRTTSEHASNLIEIHQLRELINFKTN